MFIQCTVFYFGIFFDMRTIIFEYKILFMRKMLWLGVLGCFLLLTAQCTKVIEERIYTQLPANVILSGDGAPALNLGKVGD